MSQTIEEYILNIGTDLSCCDLTDVDITRADLRNIKLPDDPNLFQIIKNKSLFKTKLPENDYSKYNFKGVYLSGAEFTNNSLIPKQKELFQEIKDGELFETKLPKINMNDYDFANVKISKTIFTKDTVFSEDTNFFQIIFNKSIYATKLPVYNYELYDFTDVCIVECDFQEESSLPQTTNFFQKVRDKSALNSKLPSNTIKDLNMYNLNDVEIDLNKYNINIFNASHMYRKYYHNTNIEFPDIELTIRSGKEIKINGQKK